ncbi:protein of unknown function (DU1801) [Massilia sp. CF038]|nr:protein of unknown function (DU1801) [Massilia sp. CF038]
MHAFSDPAVKAIFDGMPAPARARLLQLRALIFTTAAALEHVGPLQETLKWGEPAYLTAVSKSGSTIRLGWNSKMPARYALYFNCQTDLIASFRLALPDEFHYEGNRAIVFDVAD